MRNKFRFAILAIFLASWVLLAIAIPAAAKEYPARPFMLPQDVTVNGAPVKAGTYELLWETQRSNVKLMLRKDGNLVATAQGVLVKNGAKYSQDQALLLVNSDGSRSLIEIRVAGASQAIVLNQNETGVHYTALKR